MIRAAQARDAGAICALWNEMILHSLATFTTLAKTDAEIVDLIASRQNAFWIAERSGDAAGFVTFGPFRGGPGYAFTVEHSIVLNASAQGSGVASDLLGHAETQASAQGMRVMIAGISSANPRAIRFHAKYGYEQVGYLPEVGYKSGQWLDLILMQKNLSQRLHSD